MPKFNKVEARKVYIRELVRQINFALKEIEITASQSSEDFYNRMVSNTRIGFAVNGLYNGDGLIDPLEGAKENVEEKK